MLGLAWHAVIAFCLLTHYAAQAGKLKRSPGTADPALESFPAILMVPLLRILSATMPVKALDPLYWPALTGAPLLLAVALSAKALNLRRATLGLCLPSWPVQALIGSSGLLLGLAGFVLASSEVHVNDGGVNIVTVSLILVVFASVLEEVLFRGLIRGSLEKVSPAYSVGASSLLFTACYLGSGPILQLAIIAPAGLYFGWCAKRTRSIVGISLAHALMKLGMLVIWPMVFG